MGCYHGLSSRDADKHGHLWASTSLKSRDVDEVGLRSYDIDEYEIRAHATLTNTDRTSADEPQAPAASAGTRLELVDVSRGC